MIFIICSIILAVIGLGVCTFRGLKRDWLGVLLGVVIAILAAAVWFTGRSNERYDERKQECIEMGLVYVHTIEACVEGVYLP